MRLLNTSTQTLTEFQSDIPPYAILSHMWQREEVAFRDITDLKKAKAMRGFAKIVGACDTAKRDGFGYIWIDTCCINKESSAELSEAINSMYTWYKNACVCYAYLWDVPSEGGHKSPPPLFAMSLWFTRGWTLQELIAPRRVVFYTRDWVDVGTKASLQEIVSAVTGISTEVIVGESVLDTVPVAVRMSWASDRNTTREEDAAYSLMGLFGVNMPLLYGEGEKAFIRMQHEIIKKSNDHSIFAWTAGSDQHRGILARSPREFRLSCKVERIPRGYPDTTQPNNHTTNSPTPYSITNQGLHIQLPIVAAKDETLAILNCRLSGKSDPIAIVLVWNHDLQQYTRRSETTLRLERTVKGSTSRLSSLYIADDYQTGGNLHHSRILDLEVKVPLHYTVPNIISSGFVRSQEGQIPVFSAFPLGNAHLLVFNEPHKFKPFAVIVGARESGVVWCNIVTDVKVPVGGSNDKIMNAYRTASATYQATNMPFRDRNSVSLVNGWSVTVSLALPSGPGSRLRGEVEITESLGQQRPVPPLVRPAGGTAYLVILPTPSDGFVVDTDNLQEGPYTTWVQHLHSFILSTSNFGEERLRFKSTTTKEGFNLVLRATSGVPKSSIEKVTLDGGVRWAGGGETYNAILGNGKSVFVTQRECRDTSVADFVLTLST